MPWSHSIPTLGILLQKNMGANPGERERVSQSAQLRAGISPVLEATHQLLPTQQRQQEHLLSSSTPNAGREKVEEAGLGEPQKTILKYFKINNLGHCQEVMDIKPGKNEQHFLIKNAKLSRESISRCSFFL